MTPESAIKLGWYLFPAYWGYSHKAKGYTHIPLVPWGTESSKDPKVIAAWREKFPKAYLCVAAVRSGITIFDVDNKKGKKGDNTVDLLEMAYGELPETLMATTPSNGTHRFYTGSTKVGAGRFGEGVDSAPMAPLPGTDIPGKGKYELVKDTKTAELPSWCFEIAGKPNEKGDREDTGDTTHIDTPPTIAQATLYLQTAPIAIPDSGTGDSTLYNVACAVRDCGVSEQTARGLMLQYYAPRCPQYSVISDAVPSKVENAFRYALSKQSESNVASGFEAVEEPGDSGIVSWEDLSVKPDPREWVVHGWIPKHEVTALYGDGGSGKSLAALKLTIAVNLGKPWFGLVTEQAKTLYVSCEDDKEELKRRGYAEMKMSMFTPGENPLNLWARAGEQNLIVTKGLTKLERGPFYKGLCDMLKSMGEGHKFLVLDTISDIYGGSEIERAEASQFIKHYLKRLCLRYDCTILLIGHTNKQGDYSGSTGWRNSVRSLIQMSLHTNKNLTDYRHMWTGKANYGSAQNELTLQWVDGTFIHRQPGEVIDTTFEKDCNHVMDLIVKQAETGSPFGAHHNTTPYIYSGHVTNPSGKPYDKEYLKSIIGELVSEGDIEIVKGAKRGNGIWPLSR